MSYTIFLSVCLYLSVCRFIHMLECVFVCDWLKVNNYKPFSDCKVHSCACTYITPFLYHYGTVWPIMSVTAFKIRLIRLFEKSQNIHGQINYMLKLKTCPVDKLKFAQPCQFYEGVSSVAPPVPYLTAINVLLLLLSMISRFARMRVRASNVHVCFF